MVNFNDMLTKSYTAEDMHTAKGANSLLAMACNELGKRFAYMNVKCGGMSKQDQDLLLEMWKDDGFQRGFKDLLTAKCTNRSIRPQEL